MVVSHDGDEITNVTMSDHDRLGWEAVMAALFALFLLLFAGPAGIRAILSFVVTVLAIWKVLIPLYLRGVDPIWLGLALTLVLTVLIIALVYGFDRRCAAAVSGSFLGILVTALLGIFFTQRLQIHGAVMAYSESLLYSGYQHLDLTRIFMASIFLGASGAVMDLSVDITSAVWGGGGEAAGSILAGGGAFGRERGKSRHGHHDHHPAFRLLRRLCGA